MSDHVITPPAVNEKVKTFTFSNQELEVLKPRQAILDQYSIIGSDLNLFIQSFISNQVIPRIGVDPEKFDISFNIRNGEIYCHEKPPKIIKPEEGIILPNGK